MRTGDGAAAPGVGRGPVYLLLQGMAIVACQSEGLVKEGDTVLALAGHDREHPLSAIVAAFDGTDRATGLDLDGVLALEPYWEALRKVYAPFDVGQHPPTGRVYQHEIPGGQLSNLYQQAAALGLADRFELIEDAYAGADRMLGRLVKVTPSSKVVGDLALTLVAKGVTADEFASRPEAYDIPESVIGFFRGELGEPAGGWVEPLRSRVLAQALVGARGRVVVV